MAEKEERIGITKFKETETPDFELCAYHLITRTEVIERMAKAISKAFLDDKGNPQGATDKELAEAALNALLEGK